MTLATYILSDGYTIPAIGFGTYLLQGAKGVRQMEEAISNGYRYLDTAYNYENEGAVGQAIKNSSVPRDQITVASKLPGRYHAYDDALVAIQESLMRLGLDYIDVYYIHWPNPKEDKYVEAWQAVLAAQKAGLVRSVATSNFLPEHIDCLEKETGVLPVLNQVEIHPDFNQADQLAYDQSKNIITVGWSPLSRGVSLDENFEIIKDLAAKYKKSEAQIILRWNVDRNIIPIPKSGNTKRQQENLDIFDFQLTADEVKEINQISRPDGRRKNQDPAVYQEF